MPLLKWHRRANVEILMRKATTQEPEDSRVLWAWKLSSKQRDRIDNKKYTTVQWSGVTGRGMELGQKIQGTYPWSSPSTVEEGPNIQNRLALDATLRDAELRSQRKITATEYPQPRKDCALNKFSMFSDLCKGIIIVEAKESRRKIFLLRIRISSWNAC
jgi:hypothetical protein